MSQYGKLFETAIAAELRAEKARKSITEAEIAEKLGIHRVSVSRYMSGARSIPIATFGDLCRILNLDAFEIVNRAEISARKENAKRTDSNTSRL